MQVALAPHAITLEVLAPLPHPAASPLPRLALFQRLRALQLRHIHAHAALPALSGLALLQQLDATGAAANVLQRCRSTCLFLTPVCCYTPHLPPPRCCRPAVFFPAAVEGWLDWAASLGSLRELRLAAAPMRLQSEEDGLRSLLPLQSQLQGLRLDGCMVLSDAGTLLLAQFRCGSAGPVNLICRIFPAVQPASRRAPPCPAPSQRADAPGTWCLLPSGARSAGCTGSRAAAAGPRGAAPARRRGRQAAAAAARRRRWRRAHGARVAGGGALAAERSGAPDAWPREPGGAPLWLRLPAGGA